MQNYIFCKRERHSKPDNQLLWSSFDFYYVGLRGFSKMTLFKKGQILTDIVILDAVSDGSGLARIHDCVVFVPGGLPGDVVSIILTRKEKKFWNAQLLEITTPSPDRIQAACEHFGICGGCKWQSLTYAKQLFFKEKQLQDAIQRIGDVEPLVRKPILANKTAFEFRNKLEFTFSEKGWLTQAQIQSQEVLARQALGFHVQGFFDRVLPVTRCFLMDDRVNDVRNAVYEFCKEQRFSFFNLKYQTGLLRQLVFRTSTYFPDFMVILILSEPEQAAIDAIFSFLQLKFPFLTSFVWIVNNKKNDQYIDLPFYLWERSRSKNLPYIREKLLCKEFVIGPTSFFQTNTLQAERLYSLVKEAINRPVQLLWDLYCGTGSIGITLASLAKKIIGIEFSENSIADAVRNCQMNGLENFSFFSGDITKILKDNTAILLHGKPDVVVVDPPRVGLHPEVVSALNLIQPKQIVYVSCNPATQARDIKTLSENYQLRSIQAVDMFPQTSHVESVADLWLKD